MKIMNPEGKITALLGAHPRDSVARYYSMEDSDSSHGNSVPSELQVSADSQGLLLKSAQNICTSKDLFVHKIQSNRAQPCRRTRCLCR